MNTISIINEKVFKSGYVVRRELVDALAKNEPPVEWIMAYTPNGHYIGTPKDAYHLCVNLGIQPELRTPTSQTCSIGFSRKDGKWYGWSHRAIYGFRIGSTCRKGDSHYVSTNDGGRGEWTALTVADARQMACDFADSVS